MASKVRTDAREVARRVVGTLERISVSDEAAPKVIKSFSTLHSSVRRASIKMLKSTNSTWYEVLVAYMPVAKNERK